MTSTAVPINNNFIAVKEDIARNNGTQLSSLTALSLAIRGHPQEEANSMQLLSLVVFWLR